VHALSLRQARRLALARAGLLKPGWTGLPKRAAGSGPRAREAALAHVRRFGYLQLDTVAVAGARSHALVLLSRLDGLDAQLPETLLQEGEPLFEYWGHEASWIPLDLYPAFEFRRRAFRKHPWWGDVIGSNRPLARRLQARIREEGALRSADMEGRGSRGWWDLKAARKVAAALWSSGELAIAERSSFLRSFDLSERVIPQGLRARPLKRDESLDLLLLKALDGHGWASAGTLAQTWRLRNGDGQLRPAFSRLEERGEIEACALIDDEGKRRKGWIRPDDLELAERLERVRPRRDRGVLLSPFDPVLWDRARVRRLFGFEMLLEIFKPEAQRVYGYYCLPVLAGDALVARVDLKADRRAGLLRVLSRHFESGRPSAADREAVRHALARLGRSLGLTPRSSR
jgi:uncharacterized protein YcaQ